MNFVFHIDYLTLPQHLFLDRQTLDKQYLFCHLEIENLDSLQLELSWISAFAVIITFAPTCRLNNFAMVLTKMRNTLKRSETI